MTKLLESRSPRTPVKTIIAVTSVTLNKTATSMIIGGTEKLKASIVPENAANQNVVWTSSNTNAMVSNDGLVTALNAGTAVIIASSVDGGFTGTCTVTVSVDPTAVAGVSLNKTTVPLQVGGTDQLTPIFNPTNATNQNVTWSTSDYTKVTVSESGLVTGESSGQLNHNGYNC